jgi:putative ABC transport system permease protein
MLQDLKIAVRHLLRTPGFTATAVLMLALAIGATTAIFSVVEAVLLRPLPFPQPEKLVSLGDVLQGVDVGASGIMGVTGPDVVNYTRDTHTFSALGGYRQMGYELSGMGDPASVNAARLSSGIFSALGVQPILGRVFTPQEDQQQGPVAVLSYATWMSRFHGDAQVLGKKILLDRKPYEVIGVMPRSFEFPLLQGHLNRSELWVPLSFRPDELAGGGQGSWNFAMVGRLRPGVSAAQAQQDAERVAQETMRNYPAFMSSLHIQAVVHSLRDDTVADARPLVRTLFLAVVVVLLIACANLAGLLLVRAIRRRREIAVRLALGARAATLLRQAILESLSLSVAGGLLGLLLAALALNMGTRLLPETLPRISEIGLNWKVVAFSLFLAILTGVICGLAPAFAAIRTSVNDALKDGGRTGTTGGGHARLRSALVVGEIAIAMMLLAASGLLLRSFEKMRSVELGFRPDHIITGSWGLPHQHYTSQTQVDGFNSELLRRLRQLPGVQSVGITSLLPAAGSNANSGFVVDGYVPPKGTSMSMAWQSQVLGDYFPAMGIKLLRGRLFTDADKVDTPLVILVNRKVAQHYWPGQDPIGKRIRWGLPETPTPWETVVGVVDDVKQGGADQDTREQVYQPVSQAIVAYGSLAPAGSLSGDGGFVVLRTAMPPEQMENALRSTVRSIDPQLPLTQVQSMTETLSESEAPRRFNTIVISSFGAAAILLAALGIYSVIAFTVALRTQEMAIRMALGSQRSGILGLVLASGVRLAVIGCVLGLAGSLALSKLLRTLLFNVSPFDPVVLALASIFVLLLVLAASLLPARRAAGIDPMRALRAE